MANHSEPSKGLELNRESLCILTTDALPWVLGGEDPDADTFSDRNGVKDKTTQCA